MSYQRTSRRPKSDKRSVYITTAIIIVLIIIALALYLGTDLFKNKERGFSMDPAPMTIEAAVKNAENIIEATVGKKTETKKENVSAITSKEGDSVDFVIYEKNEIECKYVYAGKEMDHVYTLGGSYEGYNYLYDNSASLNEGENVILLLDSDGFPVGEQVGVFRINGETVTNDSDKAFNIALSSFAEWLQSIRNGETPTVNPSATHGQEPTSTPAHTPDSTPSVSPSSEPLPTTITNTVASISTDDALRRSNSIVRGTVQSIGEVKSYIEEGETYYYTEVSIKVTGVISGDGELKDTVIKVKQLGGVMGNITYVYNGEPSMKAGGDVILALSPSDRIVGGLAGYYTVSSDGMVTSEKTGVSQDMNAFVIGVSRVLEG